MVNALSSTNSCSVDTVLRAVSPRGHWKDTQTIAGVLTCVRTANVAVQEQKGKMPDVYTDVITGCCLRSDMIVVGYIWMRVW